MKQVAIIGVTGYGKVHADMVLAAHAIGRWKPAAAVVINPEAAGETLQLLKAAGCQVYADYESMLHACHGTLDLVCIPTAIHWHKPMALAALRAGANVLVEKPLAGSPQDAEEIAWTARETGRWVTVGFQDIYQPVVWRLKEEILAGKIGKLRRVRMLASWPRDLAYYRRNNWAGRLHLDGKPVFDSPLNNALAHYVNLMLFLAGPQRKEAAAARIAGAHLFRAQEIESFDTASVHAVTEADADMWFHVTHSAVEHHAPVIQIEGDHGTIAWNVDGNLTQTDSAGNLTELKPKGFCNDSRERMMETVDALLEGRESDYCSPEIALAHCRFIADIHAATAIRDIDPALVDRSNPERITVRGLFPQLREAYETNRLLEM